MTNGKGYKKNEKKSEEKGIVTYDVYSCDGFSSWDGFSNFFNDEFVTKRKKDKNDEKNKNDKLYLGNYVWRGQPCEKELVSSFDREFMTDNENFVYDPDRVTILKRHLNSFVYAVRGKLKEFGLTIREIKAAIRNEELSKNHIWALAQHYGLKTPLLDWSYSAYVAAYFAFQEKKEPNKHRIVWGLNYKKVCDNYERAGVFNTGIKYFDPMSSEHPRLINQRGLFTITKDKKAFTEGGIDEIDIEKIIKGNECADCNTPWLIKLEIIDSEEKREEFLRRLSAMNINHMSLFPEIKGAAEFCNTGLKFYEYARFHGQRWWY